MLQSGRECSPKVQYHAATLKPEDTTGDEPGLAYRHDYSAMPPQITTASQSHCCSQLFTDVLFLYGYIFRQLSQLAKGALVESKK